MSKDHETEGRPNHATCGFAIGTLDITRHLGFREGAAIEAILLAGDAPAPVEKIPGEGRKARRRRARKLAKLEGINEAIDLLIDVANELEAELETDDILGDPSNLAAILEGMDTHALVTSPAFWNASDDKLHGRETAEHSAQLDLEQDELDGDESVTWGGTRTSFINVRYSPQGDNDPWGEKQWTEAFKGIESVGEVKELAASQMHFGYPEGWSLVLKGLTGNELPLHDFDVISDVLRPGATVFLKRREPSV